jgi:hypothetical protein
VELLVASILVSATLGADPAAIEAWVRDRVSKPAGLEGHRDVVFQYLTVKAKIKRPHGDITVDGSLPEYPGMSVMRYTVWWRDSDNWRVNIDHPGIPPQVVQYNDIGVFDGLAWISGFGHMTISRTEWGMPAGMNVESFIIQASNASSLFIGGNFSPRHGSVAELISIRASNPKSIVSLVQYDGILGKVYCEIRGEWLPEMGIIQTTEAYARSGIESGSEDLGRISFGGLKWIPSVQLSVHEWYLMSSSKDGWSKRFVFEKLEPIDATLIEDILQPSIDGRRDAVRGVVEWQTVSDYRTTRPTFLSRTQSGTQTTEDLPILPGMDRGSVRAAWVLSGVLVSFICISCVYRFVKSRRSS